MRISEPEAELQESFAVINPARRLRLFPWLRLFRAFRIAIDYRCLFVALIGILLWSTGLRTLQGLTTESDQRWVAPVQLASAEQPPLFNRDLSTGGQANAVIARFATPASILNIFVHHVQGIHWFFMEVFLRGVDLISLQNTVGHRGLLIVELVWSLFIAALFGGVISRITAVDVAGGGDGSLVAAARHARQHLLRSLCAPLTTLIGIIICFVPLYLGGLVGRIPVVGVFLLGAFWIVAVAIGLALLLITLGVGCGWPIMFATLSVEGSDSFDGLSRAYSYLFNRPWYLSFLLLLMTVYGVVLLEFVIIIERLTIDTTVACLVAGGGRLEFAGPGAWGMAFWNLFLESLPAAFCFSYYWTSITIIYFLLRHKEDGTPFTRIGIADGGGIELGLPLSGVAAANYREQRRNTE